MSDSKQLKEFFKYIYEATGYDFRDYSSASLERRVEAFRLRKRLTGLDSLREALESENSLLNEFVEGLTVQVTEMFRDPLFYKSLRENVVDILKTYPRIKIWHAGCSNGAEVYSMAILLHEAGVLDRTRIYATDINEIALKQAQRGIYDIKDMQFFTKNYLQSGGEGDFADYYLADSHSVMMNRVLKDRITFSFHNLATDWTFTEAHLIVCRNVLIYFEKNLQDRVFGLFRDSLVRRGMLALGTKESLRFSSVADKFEPIDNLNRIFRLKG